MALTSSGWVAKRYPEIFAELQTKLRNEIDPELDVSSTSLAGQITAIFAAAIASQYELAQAVYDSGNKDKAEGKNLDDLAALVGITRNTAFPSSGPLILTAANNTLIPAGTQFKTLDNKNTVSNRVGVAVVNSNCYYLELVVSTVANNTNYSVNINGVSFTHTSSSTATSDGIVNGLNVLIANYLAATPTAGYTAAVVSGKLVLTSSSYNNTLSVVIGARMGPSSVKAVVTGYNSVEGSVAILPETVKQVVTPIAGLTAVTNPVEWQYGRDVETDEELRERMTRSVQIAGKATVPAIRAALENITGVTSVSILENVTMFNDTNGMPPKSYQCIVEGGEDQAIADTIWETKPAGIETFSVNGNGGMFIVQDSNGQDQVVYFTRPIPQYIWIKVAASLYNEEVFPTTGGEDAIKNAVVRYGSSLGVGTDVICKRFYGSVYNSVPGIGNLVITAATTPTPTDIPDDGDYTEIIPIGGVQVSRFDTSRVFFTIV